MESRKNPHFLSSQKGFLLTNIGDWKNLKETYFIDDKQLKLYSWKPEILDSFMRKNWSISHSCHTNEPFGYSIFQAVDYGKMPILHTSWEPNLDYKYTSESIIGFLLQITVISEDSDEILQKEFTKLKNFMKKFDNKEMWISRMVSLMKN
jgi:hypothetical protein